MLGGAVLQDLRGDLEIEQGGANPHRASSFALRVSPACRPPAASNSAADRPFTGPVDLNSVDPRAFAEWLDGKADAAKLPARPLRGFAVS